MDAQEIQAQLSPLPDGVARQPVTVELMLRLVPQAIRDYVAEFVAGPLSKRLRAIDRRLADLEARPVVPTYKGVWREGEYYPAGSFVTHSGGLWFAHVDTETRPGT